MFGPHSLNNAVMEPLDLGPNAGSHPRTPPLADVGTQPKNDMYEDGDRFSLGELSVGSGQAEVHGSNEVMRDHFSLFWRRGARIKQTLTSRDHPAVFRDARKACALETG